MTIAREAERHVPEHRPPRRWPAALASLGVACGVALTAVLVVQDRSNSSAASSSKANAARDAYAVESLREVAKSMEYASLMASFGVVGLRDLSLNTYLDNAVSPLGGTLTLATGGWTLALGGGWACLTWTREATARTWHVHRGICPGAPIDATPAVTVGQVRAALRRTSALEHAADVASFAAAASPRTHASLEELLKVFRGHNGDLPFRWNATAVGVSVVTDASAACLRTVHHEVAVSLGACR